MAGGQYCLGPGVEDKPAAYPMMEEELPAGDLGARSDGREHWHKVATAAQSRPRKQDAPRQARGCAQRSRFLWAWQSRQVRGVLGTSFALGCLRLLSGALPLHLSSFRLYGVECARSGHRSSRAFGDVEARSSCQTVPATADSLCRSPPARWPALSAPHGQAYPTRAFAGASCIQKTARISSSLPAHAVRACPWLDRIPVVRVLWSFPTHQGELWVPSAL